MKDQLTWYDKELQQKLAAAVQSGDARFTDCPESSEYRLFEVFPFDRSSLVAWCKVTSSCSLIMAGLSTSEAKTALATFWRKHCVEAKVTPQEWVWIKGDALTSTDLLLRAGHLELYLYDILSIPHKTLVFPENYGWCLTYDMLDTVTVGRAVPTSPQS
jgi:hypothetical protein